MAWHVAALMSPPDKQATAMAKIALGFNFANVLGSPIGTFIGQQFGWRSTFVYITVFAVLCLLLIQKFVPSARCPPRATRPRRAPPCANR